MHILLLVPARRFDANRWGVGWQVPLGLLCVGGPLIDAGHRVTLLDDDRLGLDDDALVAEVARLAPDAVFVGHTGSTAAHPVAVRTIRAIKARLPDVTTVYGGVYPSHAAEHVMAEVPEVDVVVRGEAEGTVVELAEAIAGARAPATVRGIAWRDGERVVVNALRPALADLDRWRIAYELVDFADYPLFGFGGAAGSYLSRGCTLKCTYCGQWSYWRKWRYRSPERFVDELAQLAARGVKMVWLADESFAADRAVVERVLDLLVARDLGLSLNVNMTAADVVRDLDLLARYKLAGVDHVVMGIESLSDTAVAKVHKNNPLAVSAAAVAGLREHRILSLVNVMFGIEEERPATLWRTFRGLLSLDPDIVNAVYLTPHHWAAEGRGVDPASVIQPDQARFTYRDQVLATRIAPWVLFVAVKAIELLFHARPRAVKRLLFEADERLRRLLRAYVGVGLRVWLAEVVGFARGGRVRPGTLGKVPGYPTARPERERAAG